MRVKKEQNIRNEASINDDRKQAVIKFFNADPNLVDVKTSSGYDGPVTEVTFNGNVYWVLTDEEAQREATADFLQSGLRGSDIANDPVLSRMAERSDILDYDKLREIFEDDFDEEDEKEELDEEDLYDKAQMIGVEELWDNDIIDREAFCEALWENWGYGHDLDLDNRNESEEVNGVYYNIILREGEWED